MPQQLAVTDIATARAWINAQDHQARVWFATRCALRALPSIGQLDDIFKADMLLASVRALMTAEVVARCPDLDAADRKHRKWLDLAARVAFEAARSAEAEYANAQPKDIFKDRAQRNRGNSRGLCPPQSDEDAFWSAVRSKRGRSDGYYEPFSRAGSAAVDAAARAASAVISSPNQHDGAASCVRSLNRIALYLPHDLFKTLTPRKKASRAEKSDFAADARVPNARFGAAATEAAAFSLAELARAVAKAKHEPPLSKREEAELSTMDELYGRFLFRSSGHKARRTKRRVCRRACPSLQRQSDAAYFEAAQADCKYTEQWPKLWHEPGMPKTVADAWIELENFMNDAPEVWGFWRKWYSGFLEGTPLPLELVTRVFAVLSSADWDQGPAHVAQKIPQICHE